MPTELWLTENLLKNSRYVLRPAAQRSAAFAEHRAARGGAHRRLRRSSALRRPRSHAPVESGGAAPHLPCKRRRSSTAHPTCRGSGFTPRLPSHGRTATRPRPRCWSWPPSSHGEAECGPRGPYVASAKRELGHGVTPLKRVRHEGRATPG